jgi:hypothetical protein
MSYLTIVFRLIPFAIKMMGIAEKLFDDIPDSGSDKKAMVMGAVEGLFEAVLSVSSESNAKVWVKIEPAISAVIDAACGFMFTEDGVA